MMPLACVLGFGTSFCRIEEQVYSMGGEAAIAGERYLDRSIYQTLSLVEDGIYVYA
jgi:hypothetical protein